MPVTALLANMQATRMQMALVIDEYGGTDGLVSLEDVVEMIVGDIEDEHDDDDGPMIVPDGDGGLPRRRPRRSRRCRQAVGSEFATGEDGEDVDTIGGLVFSLLGRVPVRGELVTRRRLRVRDPRRRSAPHQEAAHLPPPASRRRRRARCGGSRGRRAQASSA